jgi:hypothetical protein
MLGQPDAKRIAVEPGQREELADQVVDAVWAAYPDQDSPHPGGSAQPGAGPPPPVAKDRRTTQPLSIVTSNSNCSFSDNQVAASVTGTFESCWVKTYIIIPIIFVH